MDGGRASDFVGIFRRRLLCAGLFTLFLLVGAEGDRACYSGLCLIPTTDTVARKYFSFEFQVDGTVRRLTADSYIFNVQFGLTDRLEAGVDFDFSEEAEHRAYFNFKWVALEGKNDEWAVAVGVQAMDSRVRKQGPYVVAMKDFRLFRGHLGAMYVEGATHLIAGVDRGLTERLTVMADYIAGRQNYSSAGIDWIIRENVEILAGVLFPNNGEGGTRYTVHLVISGPLRFHR